LNFLFGLNGKDLAFGHERIFDDAFVQSFPKILFAPSFINKITDASTHNWASNSESCIPGSSPIEMSTNASFLANAFGGVDKATSEFVNAFWTKDAELLVYADLLVGKFESGHMFGLVVPGHWVIFVMLVPDGSSDRFRIFFGLAFGYKGITDFEITFGHN
jgi:hypothetical protein